MTNLKNTNPFQDVFNIGEENLRSDSREAL